MKKRFLIALMLLALAMILTLSACAGEPHASCKEGEHKYYKYGEASPTCNEVGYIEWCCDVCLYQYTETIEALGHNYKVDTYVAPTCYDNGYISKTCTRCQNTASETIEAPYEHLLEEHAAKAPTCTEIGWDAYETCKRCDHNTYYEQEALEHLVSEEWTIDTEPTENTVGSRSNHCEREGCNYHENDTEIPKSPYSDWLIYQNNGESLTVVGIEESHKEETTILAIPPEYNGLPVTAIAENAFKTNRSLLMVKIPASVTVIHRSAFEFCTELMTVEIAQESQLEVIAASAFTDCYSLTRINLPEGLTELGDKCFNSCGFNSEFVIPDSVQLIGAGALANCRIESLTIPFLGKKLDGLREAWHLGHVFGTANNNYGVPSSLKTLVLTRETAIYGDSLKDCYYLENLSIPNTLEILRDSLLDSFDEENNGPLYGVGNLNYTKENGLKYIGNSENPYLILIGAEDGGITGCVINENTKFIHNSAFKYCSLLTEIVIPDSVVYIGGFAFKECEGLTSVTLGSYVKEIGNGAFKGCKALTGISFPASVEYIGVRAFDGCEKITSVTIGSSIKMIGAYAFYGCGLTSAYFEVKTGWEDTYYPSTAISEALLADSWNCAAWLIGDSFSRNIVRR